MSRLPNAWQLAQAPPPEPEAEEEFLNPPAVDPSEELAAVDDPMEPEADRINVNEASKLLLVSLPGIGPKSANDIIKHRPYTSVDEMIEKASLTRLDEADIAIITNSVTF